MQLEHRFFMYCSLCDLAGPIGDTMPDFWRMVWEKNVSIVVMLTGIIERGRVSALTYVHEVKDLWCSSTVRLLST